MTRNKKFKRVHLQPPGIFDLQSCNFLYCIGVNTKLFYLLGVIEIHVSALIV